MRTADLCPECARPTEDRDLRGSRSACPHCGSPLDRNAPARWINVARVANLAEAGFLVDELAGEGIEARIYQSEDFSALTDRWQVSYLIQSPPSAAPSAAARIRRHLAEMEAYPDPASDGDWSGSHPAVDPFTWRPMALVILAGMASFALGQRFAPDHDPPKAPRNSLSTAISAIGRPLATEPAPGLARHRLYYHWREQAWYLDTDADADGQFETHQRFHASGSRW
ncbi:MAG: hypothetical protein AB7G28_09895 [Pirellulales bacterium]